MDKKDFTFSIRDITEIGILCALAIILDTFVKVPVGENGGSINIAMVPLFLIALHKGWFKGLIAGGIVFGLLSCLIDGYGFVTYPLDYLVAYGGVAVVGVMRNLIIKEKIDGKSYLFYILAILVAFVIRLIGATIDGIILWETPFVDSLIYNLTYLIPSFAICEMILVPTLTTFNDLFKRLS